MLTLISVMTFSCLIHSCNDDDDDDDDDDDIISCLIAWLYPEASHSILRM